MDCKDFQKLFSDMHDGLLKKEDRERLGAHLQKCERCASGWELFEESLASLPILCEGKAPNNFTERVLRRIESARAEKAAGGAWRFVYTPAGIACCLLFLFVGMAAGFFLGKQQVPFPPEEVKTMLQKDGIALLPAGTKADPQYVLIPIETRAAARAVPSRVPPRLPQADEILIGGSESHELYLRPGRYPDTVRTATRTDGDSTSRDQIYRALLEQSY
jgi:hypothetical protein